jgi:hypothetical protein
MAPLPSKPQSVLVERWLPYQETKRRIIYKGAPSDPVLVKPRNVVIQWEAPNVVVRKVSKFSCSSIELIRLKIHIYY